MNAERHVKLFKNGRNQAVRIPKEFELPGEDAIMRKEGDRLIIEAAPPRSLLAILAQLSPIAEVGERVVFTSIIVAAELRYGLAKKRSERLAAQVERILAGLEIVAFDEPAAAAYAVEGDDWRPWARPLALMTC